MGSILDKWDNIFHICGMGKFGGGGGGGGGGGSSGVGNREWRSLLQTQLLEFTPRFAFFWSMPPDKT